MSARIARRFVQSIQRLSYFDELRKLLLMRAVVLWLLIVVPFICHGGDGVLIVADEFPAMEVLARELKEEQGIDSRIIKQVEMPSVLQAYRSVIVYIHGKLMPSVERACIEYANGGGRLLVLHHSISSGKRTNEVWFDFLGVKLAEGEASRGGYKWIEPVTYQVVKLADHFITTNTVLWPEMVDYSTEQSENKGHRLSGFTLRDSEVYLNHQLSGKKTFLLGFKYKDSDGTVWMQNTAGWYQAAGKGVVFYFQPGHSPADFENPTFARLLLNTIIWRP